MDLQLLIENYLLLENAKRIDFLNDHFKDGFDTSHDTLAKHTETKDIINHFAKKADPTSNKSHSQWVLNQYKQGNIRQEDAGSIKKTLKDFDKSKDHLEKKDINQYKHVADLRDAVVSKVQIANDKEKEKKKLADNKGEDLRQLYDKDGVTGFKIPNRESSIRNYGANGTKAKTNWCTAANSTNNMFNHYKGGKYTMHFPNGHVLQFHHQSRQIMDEKDVPVDSNDPRYHDNLNHINDFLNHTHELEKHPDTNLKDKYKRYSPEETNEHLDRLIKGESNYQHENALDNIISNNKLSKEHVAALTDHNGNYDLEKHYKKYLKKNPHVNANNVSEDDWHHLSQNPNRSSDMLHHELDNIDKYHPNKGAKSISGYNTTLDAATNRNDDHLTKILKNPKFTDSLTGAAFDRDSNNPSHTNQEKYASISPENTKRILINQKDISPKLLDVGSKEYPEEFSKHMQKPESANNLHQHHFENILKSGEEMLNRNPGDRDTHHTISNITNHILHTKNPEADGYKASAVNLFHNMLSHDKNKEKLLSNHASNSVLTSNKLSKDDVNSLWDATKNNIGARANLAKNDKIDGDKLHDHIDGGNANADIMDNKNIKGEHLEKLIKTTHNPERILDHKKFDHENMNRSFSDAKRHDVVSSMLHHPKVTQTMQMKALATPHQHAALSSSPFTSPSILHKLADSPAAFIRKNVVQHKNTDNDTYKKLLNDGDSEVSEIANKKVKH